VLNLLTPDHLFHADPTCREIDGRFYLFVTHDQATADRMSQDDDWENMFDYKAFSTEDFVHWVNHGSIFSAFDVPWAKGRAVWDGDAGFRVGNHYMAFFPVRNDAEESFEIGVFQADSPAGHYRDVLGKPLVTNADLKSAGFSDATIRACLSPTVIWDESGNPYLLFGQFAVYAARLAPDFLSLAGPIFEIEIPKKIGGATEYIEGPMIDKIGSQYYFTYMAYKNYDGAKPSDYTDQDPEGPYIRYCVSDSQFGPFRNPRHWIYPVAPGACNNQQGLARFKGQWYVAYHVPHGSTQHRRVGLDRVKVEADGSLKPIFPGRDPGILEPEQQQMVLEPGQGLHWMQDADLAQKAEWVAGRGHEGAIRLLPGGFLRFRQMDFSRQPATVRIGWIGSPGAVELRLDAPEGPVLARITLQPQDQAEPFSVSKARLEFPAGVSVHDVVLTSIGVAVLSWMTFE